MGDKSILIVLHGQAVSKRHILECTLAKEAYFLHGPYERKRVTNIPGHGLLHGYACHLTCVIDDIDKRVHTQNRTNVGAAGNGRIRG